MRTQHLQAQPHVPAFSTANVIGALIGGLASGAAIALLLWQIL
jgi:hypothetical protein